MTARRALVTGAAGFVGAGLVRRLLSDGHQVDLLLRAESDTWRINDVRADCAVHRADLADAEMVRAAVAVAQPDWVFHLAAHGAYSWQSDAELIFKSTVLGTLNLAQACVARGFDAFVHAGSSSEYGHKDHPPTEQEAPEPNSEYAVAKVTGTLLCRHLAARHGLRMATLRLYSVYGPWEDPGRLMPTLATRAMRGELPPLVDPDTARDFVYLDDVCDAFVLAAETPVAGSDGIYNVGSGKQTTLGDLVEVVRSSLEVSVEPHWGSYEPRAWDTSCWVSDPSKIARELGWHSRVGLDEGLRGLSSWLMEHPELERRYAMRCDKRA
jgi:UDP-glucose 4-epimerase